MDYGLRTHHGPLLYCQNHTTDLLWHQLFYSQLFVYSGLELMSDARQYLFPTMYSIFVLFTHIYVFTLLRVTHLPAKNRCCHSYFPMLFFFHIAGRLMIPRLNIRSTGCNASNTYRRRTGLNSGVVLDMSIPLQQFTSHSSGDQRANDF